MEKQTTKKVAPRYDDAFKEGAIKMVIEQKLPVKQVAKELGICTDALRSWLKKSGLNPIVENHSNTLNKKLDHKNQVIETLKKSISIISNP